MGQTERRSGDDELWTLLLDPEGTPRSYYVFLNQDGQGAEEQYQSGTPPLALGTGGPGPVVGAWFTPNTGELGGDIRARVLSADGEPIKPAPSGLLLSARATGQQSTTAIVAGNGEYLVAYQNRVEREYTHLCAAPLSSWKAAW